MESKPSAVDGAPVSGDGETALGAPRARPETISRPRVQRLLDATRGAAVVLVSAPAGYGKTTALAQWCASLDCAAAWISLGEQDNDPQLLCAHLLTALERLWPTALRPARHAADGGSDLLETVVPLLSQAIAAELDAAGLVLVLDDFHHVADPTAQRLAAALIEALPAGARVVISSRTRPRLRLARQRAEGLVGELGPAELGFDVEEAGRLLNDRLRLRLDRRQVEAVNGGVEGWPAGISLMALALHEDREADGLVPALPRSRELIAEYLLDEVLGALSPRMREFLSRTSILEQICPSLCEAVADDPGAAELLDEARRTNLFVVDLAGDDDGEEWVRYHRLFADLLADDLAARTPEGFADAHRRAARWFDAAGMARQAIEHAGAAGDGPLAARMLVDHHWTLIARHRCATIDRLLARMPAERGDLGPFCEALGVVCMAHLGADPRRVAERLDALEPHREAPLVAQIVDNMRVLPYYGDIPRALDAGWRLWEATADEPAIRARMVGQFAAVLWFADEHAAIATTLAPHMGQTDNPWLRSWELAALALCAADAGELAVAEQQAREAVEIMVGNGGETAVEAHIAYIALAEALRRRGRFEEAYDQVANALRATARMHGSVFHATALVFQAQTDLTCGRRRTARRRAAAARAIVDAHPDTGTVARRLARIEAALDDRAAVATDSDPTDAERRVLALLPSDLTRDQIAARLALSPSTVKTHMWRLFRRLDATTRAEAVDRARERGLL